MKTKRQYVWAAGIALAMFAGVAVADPISDNAAKKSAAAKVATDAATASNDEVRTIIAAQGDSASKYADATRELAAAKKVLVSKAAAAKAAADKHNAAVAALKKAEADKAKAVAEKKDPASKDAAVKAAAKAVADAKAATAKPEAEKGAAEKVTKDIDAKIAAIREQRKKIDANLNTAKEKYTNVRRASYPIVAEKAAAEKALAEKVAADKAAALKVAQGKANAAKAAVAKAKAAKTAADKSSKDYVAKADAATKAVAGKKDAAKVAAEKTAKDAATKVATAKKAMADNDTAVKNAEKALVAATAVVKKASEQKTAADKNFSAKRSADSVAIQTVNGSDLYIAIRATDDAVKEKDTAEKALAKASSAESTATSTYASAKKAANAANAAKAPTDKALAAANAAKAAAKKAADAKVAAKTAVANAAAAKATGDKAVAAKKAADAANGAKATAEKALAASEATRAAAQKAADVKTAAAKTAVGKAAGAKAAMDKAVAVATAARNTLAEKTKVILPLQDKLSIERVKMQGGLKAMAGKDWTYAKARHLVVRAGFGGTPAEVQEVYEMGLHDAVDHFVEIYNQPAADIGFDPARLERNEPWEGRLPWDERQYMTVKKRNPERVQQAEMRRWWLQRMAESPRPLQEKMALFWHDHFAVQYQQTGYRSYRLFRQNQLFRNYGVDNYGALLRGIVHDPAMIVYLNNNVNYKGSGNENFGREILELFSMGVGSGYTEDDIREGSRALTGYNYDSWTGQFRNIATRHDLEPKKILGSTGNWSGDDLVDIILRQPATAKYISAKLFKFLAYDEPYDETVEKMAEVMRYSSYDLKPVLSNLFLSEEFYSDKAMGSHIKGPAELAIGAIRDLGIKDTNYGLVDAAINQMGQVLFEPPNVAGWNEGRTWINAERILIRYNQMARILESPNVDLVELLKNDQVDTSEKVVDQLVKACLVVKPDPEKCKALAQFLGKLPPQSEWEAKKNEVNAKLRAVLVLLMSSPESQLG